MGVNEQPDSRLGSWGIQAAFWISWGCRSTCLCEWEQNTGKQQQATGPQPVQQKAMNDLCGKGRPEPPLHYFPLSEALQEAKKIDFLAVDPI